MKLTLPPTARRRDRELPGALPLGLRLLAEVRKKRQFGPEVGPTPAFYIMLYSHRNAWANLHLLGRPDTVLARRALRRTFHLGYRSFKVGSGRMAAPESEIPILLANLVYEVGGRSYKATMPPDPTPRARVSSTRAFTGGTMARLAMGGKVIQTLLSILK